MVWFPEKYGVTEVACDKMMIQEKYGLLSDDEVVAAIKPSSKHT